jgi:hypothetical protein
LEKLMKSVKVLAVCIAISAMIAGRVEAADYWRPLDTAAQRSSAPIMVKAKGSHHWGDTEVIRTRLLSESSEIELPLPDGSTAIYRLDYSPIAEQGLLDKFPEIRTFKGTDINNPENSGRFDISPAGFRGMFIHNGETIFIDPQYRGQSEIYISYYSRDAEPQAERPADIVNYTDLLQSAQRAAQRMVAKGSSDGNARSYRLAVATTGEYTSFHGGTVSGALAAITTTINRVNQVFQNDLNITLNLVANNDQIIYTNAGADPFDNDGTDINLIQDEIDSVIGFANYDIGHIFVLGSGGVAQLGGVCTSRKAQGLTGTPLPTGDTFDIDFVAHEIGHQFGAEHTFNGTSGSCSGGNRNAATAYEPGSGSTVMAYAGICGDESIQSNSDAYFHAGSIEQITAFVNSTTGSSCGSLTNQSNAVPDVSAGPDVTIPVNTPIRLSGSATDANAGDTLTYVWEQMDTGTSSSSPANMVDNGSRTIFRSFEPTTSPVRYLPRLQDVVAGTTVLGESYPTTNRDLNFRLTARDGNGATAFENKLVSVVTSAGPFQVTSPSSGDMWTPGSVNVVWDVANTNVSPVNCANVDIELSVNGGTSFSISLAGSVANDGSESITVPAITSSQARVMVSCSDNVFYAISPSNFQVAGPVAPNLTSISDASETEGTDISLTFTLDASTAGSSTYPYELTDVTTSSVDYGNETFSNGVTDNGDGTITVPVGVASFTVTIPTVDDTNDENDETFTVSSGTVSGTGTIQDNDEATGGSSGGSNSGGGGVVGTLLIIMLAILAMLRRRDNLCPLRD